MLHGTVECGILEHGHPEGTARVCYEGGVGGEGRDQSEEEIGFRMYIILA